MIDPPSPYSPCLLCPRACGVNRPESPEPGILRPGPGRCGESAVLRLASASVHRGEEPPVSGVGGSGTIFVTGCALGCGFCQNYQISREGMGRPVSGEEFAGLALALRDAGVENINIVTGSHAVPALVLALDKARERGLDLPVLWNSSAYEGGEALELLRDRVDVYLPDLKTLDSRLGERFFRAPDYPGHAQAAILRMLSFQGELRWKGPVLAKGVIIRHLIIPGYMESTRNVIEWFSRHARGRALLSLMTQYTPCPPCPPGSCPAGSGPRRRLIREEYLRVMDWLTEFGVDDGFYQAPAAGSDWLPDFTRRNPFSSSLSIPVWHWKDPVPGGTAGGVFARDAESPILK